MKMLLAVAVTFMTSLSQAAPYFRPLDLAKVHKSLGAYIDPVTTSNTSLGTATALVTHSTRDGCLLPTVVCEDWSPLMAGLSANAGRLTLNVGPAANLAPLARAGILGALNGLTRGDQLPGLKGVLAPAASPVSIAFGPSLAVAPIQHGTLLPFNAWQGKFRIFAGAALEF